MPGFNENELRLLASKEFNQILSADEKLGELENQKYNKNYEMFILLDALNLGSFKIGDLPIRPLTLGKWCFLDMLESPYCQNGLQKISVIDIDIFLYILSLESLQYIKVSIAEIAAEAADYHLAANLSIEELHAEIQKLKEIAFYPLGVLPPGESSKEEYRFNAEWLMTQAVTICKICNEKLDDVIHKFPLSKFALLYVNAYREYNPEQRLYRRMDDELQKLISQRIDELSVEFLRKDKEKNEGMQHIT